MSKDLMEVKNNMPAFLQQAQAPTANEEFTSGLTGGMPLPTLSIRGKEFRLRKDGQEVSTRQRDVEAIFVAGRSGISKRYYESPYASGETEAPDCSSGDGITPDVANPVSESCKTCPNNAWGSKISESGKESKACSDYKRIVVLPLFNGDIASEPMVLDIPATSLKRPKGFKGTEMMFQEYVNVLAKHEMPAYGVVTNIGFTDAEYPQMCFSFVRFVNESEYATAIKHRESEDVATVLKERHEAPGKITEKPAPDPAPAESTPAPAESTPAPGPAPEQGEEVIYPETLAELKVKKIKPLRALAEDLGIDPKQKKPELVQALAEELELTEKKTEPVQETVKPETMTAQPEEGGEEEDDEETMAQLKSILGG